MSWLGGQVVELLPAYRVMGGRVVACLPRVEGGPTDLLTSYSPRSLEIIQAVVVLDLQWGELRLVIGIHLLEVILILFVIAGHCRSSIFGVPEVWSLIVVLFKSQVAWLAQLASQQWMLTLHLFRFRFCSSNRGPYCLQIKLHGVLSFLLFVHKAGYHLFTSIQLVPDVFESSLLTFLLFWHLLNLFVNSNQAQFGL